MTVGHDIPRNFSFSFSFHFYFQELELLLVYFRVATFPD